MAIQKQTTDTVLMIRPAAFGYNKQTAGNNYFQHPENSSPTDIQHRALTEFTAAVEKLTANGVNVFTVDDTVEPHTPDSIFPNNWISFHDDGTIILYPMFAPNRRLERRPDIIEKLRKNGFKINKTIDYSPFELENRYLEGTGSMVLDRANHIAYAALSERTDEKILRRYCTDMQYRPVVFSAFQTVNGRRLPVYHTNVMMSIADTFAVVCLQSVDKKEDRTQLEKAILDTQKEIIEITEQQLHCFAGNILQIENREGKKILAISETAFRSLSASQIQRIGRRCDILRFDVPAIESAGGGGIRCMIAEVFLPVSS
jgi:hypothetical protein